MSDRAQGGRLWAAVVDWLADAGVGEAAAVDLAELLDATSGPPTVAVRGPAGIGAAAVAAALGDHPSARGTWRVVADEGPAPRVDADAVVTLSHDPGARARPGEVVADPRVLLDDASSPASPPLPPLAAAVGELVSPEALAAVRAGRLERGVAAAAAAHPVVRDELEDLLWP
ncbi:hypothetical protein ACFWGD_07740 [Corynebacterium sp. NPDC060344]|uniref:hypothetical protein n=1 Tax=Corynebacterium sp. NPDC060344 TaxID=3347101 RepID=UPI003658B6AF